MQFELGQAQDDEDGCLQELITVGNRIFDVVQRRERKRYEHQLSNHIKQHENDMRLAMQNIEDQQSDIATVKAELNAKKCELCAAQETVKNQKTTIMQQQQTIAEQNDTILEQRKTITSLEHKISEHEADLEEQKNTVKQLEWHKNRSDAMQAAIADYELKNPTPCKKSKHQHKT